ncbi:MAG: hypothetical protein CM1200mP30_09020 [Pseudomonadota bacterium]|nr:MAG: hypothetical protein CM1200mP30_09020 [Pseudomonadota bacterium]
MSELNQKIREFREDIGQSIEGLALLMQMEPEEFARLEEDWIPPDEILQRLCSLFEWNYIDIKRLADNTPNSKTKKKNRGNKQHVLGKVHQMTLHQHPLLEWFERLEIMPVRI